VTDGYNRNLQSQIDLLHTALRANTTLYSILKKCEAISLPNYYVGAGCVAQSVWNWQDGNEPMYGIDDIDFVYYDTDLSFEAEDMAIKLVSEQLAPFGIEVDIKNQARVHLWYTEHFGYEITPYDSVEAAINSWPAITTSIGVRLKNGELEVYAPYGLNDMFGRVIRANKVQITKGIYEAKVAKWTAKWNDLTVVPW
jgi:hypothetical protein